MDQSTTVAPMRLLLCLKIFSKAKPPLTICSTLASPPPEKPDRENGRKKDLRRQQHARGVEIGFGGDPERRTTQAGTRPHFEVVSGISTGALIAPFEVSGFVLPADRISLVETDLATAHIVDEG
jgi:hypothetical protein